MQDIYGLPGPPAPPGPVAPPGPPGSVLRPPLVSAPGIAFPGPPCPAGMSLNTPGSSGATTFPLLPPPPPHPARSGAISKPNLSCDFQRAMRIPLFNRWRFGRINPCQSLSLPLRYIQVKEFGESCAAAARINKDTHIRHVLPSELTGARTRCDTFSRSNCQFAHQRSRIVSSLSIVTSRTTCSSPDGHRTSICDTSE